MWRILKNLNAFEGIRPKPMPKPTSDGSYNLKLNPIQYESFVKNLKDSIKEHEGEPEEPKEEPSKSPKKQEAKPETEKSGKAPAREVMAAITIRKDRTLSIKIEFLY